VWRASSPASAAALADAAQIARYTMPFVVISAIFWLLHTEQDVPCVVYPTT
jgi:hypothetical protein